MNPIFKGEPGHYTVDDKVCEPIFVPDPEGEVYAIMGGKLQADASVLGGRHIRLKLFWKEVLP